MQKLFIVKERAVRLPIAALEVLLVVACFSFGCAKIAVWAAHDKVAEPSTDQGKAANEKFWKAFHGGHYEEIPAVLESLTAAYLDNPSDVETAAHIGFSHIWRAAERARMDHVPATITDDIAMSHKYFAEAVKLSPSDARFAGFLASSEMSDGTIHDDQKLVRRGYFDMLDAKKAWPEFNLFTSGYVMSGGPYDTDQYAAAIEDQWKTLDLCFEDHVDRKSVTVAQYMSKETTLGQKRACWNSAIAPHNFEGFALNMGDMLVKHGDVETARLVYAIAKLSKTYATWPYRQELESRIAQAPENMAMFRDPPPNEKTRTVMLQSTFSCTGCHQM